MANIFTLIAWSLYLVIWDMLFVWRELSFFAALIDLIKKNCEHHAESICSYWTRDERATKIGPHESIVVVERSNASWFLWYMYKTPTIIVWLDDSFNAHSALKPFYYLL